MGLSAPPPPRSELPRLVNALGASYWFYTGDAHVIASPHVLSTLELDRDPRQWWDELRPHLDLPEPTRCSLCRQPEPVGSTTVTVPRNTGRSLVVDLMVLGHFHQVDKPERFRLVFLVRGVRETTEITNSGGLGEETSSTEPGPAPLPPALAPGAGTPRLGSAQVDSYLTKLSHALRTPLDAILGYSEMLLESDELSVEESQHSLERIQASGHQVLDTISELEQQIVQERHRRRLAETLSSLSATMASSLELDDVVERIYECINQVIDFDRAQILLVEDNELRVVLDRCRGQWSMPEQAPRRLSTSAPPHSHVLDIASTPVVIDSEKLEELSLSAEVHPKCQCWLGVALCSGGEPLAMICLESKTPEFYDDFDMNLMAALSHHAALAMTNAQEFVQVRQRARFDPLTEAYSRGHFFDLSERHLEDAIQTDRDLGLIVLDIDHFKPVNDTYGHLVGDEVLRQVVQQIRESLRDGDLVGRFGGEEFIVLLPDADRGVTERVADRIRRRIEETVFSVDEHRINITISAGAVSLRSTPHATVTALLESADAALYRAKESGRNAVACAEVSSAPS